MVTMLQYRCTVVKRFLFTAINQLHIQKCVAHLHNVSYPKSRLRNSIVKGCTGKTTKTAVFQETNIHVHVFEKG